MMQKLTYILIITYFAILISGCSMPYLSDRRRDIADIFTATIGVGLGGKVRAGPVQTGLLVQADGLSGSLNRRSLDG